MFLPSVNPHIYSKFSHRVCLLASIKCSFFCESHFTMAAQIRFFTSVTLPVYMEIPIPSGGFVTMAALLRLLPNVSPPVYIKI